MCQFARDRLSGAALFVLVSASVQLVVVADARGLTGAFPISRCSYRVAYDVDVDNGEFVRAHSNNFVQLAHNGVDLFGQPDIDNMGSTDPPVGYPIVAAAGGFVRHVTDSNTECCRTPAGAPEGDGCSLCNNRIWIQHNDDEFTVYFHIAPGSARVAVNQFVAAGTWIADEGDIGSVCGARSIDSRPSTGCSAGNISEADALATCAFCSVHLHFSSFRGYDGVTTGGDLIGDAFHEQVIPIICNIDNNIYEPSETYSDGSDNGTVRNCFNDCATGLSIVVGQINPGVVSIHQADVSVSAQNFVIEDSTAGAACTSNSDCTLPARCRGGFCVTRGGSVSFRAGDRVILRTGFHAKRESYFLGVIAPCNGCPAPF